MFKDKITIVILLISLLLTYSCEGGKMREKTVPLKTGEAIQESLKKVAKQRIFFGHQSVGYNILDGLRDIGKEYPQIHLNIVEIHDPSKLNGKPVFAHAPVGHNTDPVSKLEDFSKFLDRGIGNKVDIAFVKFCYVDIIQGSDIQKIFDSYKESHERLRKRYPHITFVHVTVPLTAKQTDVITMTKNLIKRIIGRPVSSYKDNIARNQFNDMLKKEYEGKEPVFDLADMESILPDGKRVVYAEDGTTFRSLAIEYTDDGGHLNELGRRVVAQQLINFLAGLPIQTIGK